MNKDLLHHSFYVKEPRRRTFTIKMFIYNVGSEGYSVYDSRNPQGHKFFNLKDDYEKYVDQLPPSDRAVKIVKHNKKTIEKILEEIKEQQQ